MKRTTLPACPRERAIRPGYPALVCIAITALAAIGCSDASQDAPDGGQDDATITEDETADSLRGPDAATDEGPVDEAVAAGCSVASFQPGASGSSKAGLATVAALCALGISCRRRRFRIRP